MNITKQTHNNKVLLFINSNSPEERRGFQYQLFNWNITNTGLREVNQQLHYVVTTKERFIEKYAKMLFCKLIDNGNSKSYKKQPAMLKKRALLGAQAKFNEIPETFVLSPEKLRYENLNNNYRAFFYKY